MRILYVRWLKEVCDGLLYCQFILVTMNGNKQFQEVGMVAILEAKITNPRNVQSHILEAFLTNSLQHPVFVTFTNNNSSISIKCLNKILFATGVGNPQSKIDQAFDAHGIKWVRREDGTIDVHLSMIA